MTLKVQFADIWPLSGHFLVLKLILTTVKVFYSPVITVH